MQTINPYLWFNDNAEEAVNFYISIFYNSRINRITRYGTSGAQMTGLPIGSVMTIVFELDGQEFVALNGGANMGFTPAIAFLVNCHDQSELDHYWNQLAEGGEIQQCGWLKDRFGISWNIVPTIFYDLMNNEEPDGNENLMNALFQMQKIDINGLKSVCQKKN